MTTPTTPAPPQPPEGTAPPPPVPPTPPEERRRPLGWGITLIGLGVVWLLVLIGVPIRWEVLLPAALIGVGLLVMLVPRSAGRDGLIALGIVLAVFAMVASLLPRTVAWSAGERVHRVEQVADLEDEYRLGAGTMTLDLRELDLTGEVELPPVQAGVGMGELIVRVPADVAVTGAARTGMGEVSTFGRSRGGIGPDTTIEEPGDGDGPVLDLRLEVGMGRIEVTR